MHEYKRNVSEVLAKINALILYALSFRHMYCLLCGVGEFMLPFFFVCVCVCFEAVNVSEMNVVFALRRMCNNYCLGYRLRIFQDHLFQDSCENILSLVTRQISDGIVDWTMVRLTR